MRKGVEIAIFKTWCKDKYAVIKIVHFVENVSNNFSSFQNIINIMLNRNKKAEERSKIINTRSLREPTPEGFLLLASYFLLLASVIYLIVHQEP